MSVQIMLSRPCPNCGCKTGEHRPKGPHIGEYCTACQSWVSWIQQRKPTMIIEDHRPFDCQTLQMEPKEPSPYDGDDDDGCMPWEE